MKHKITLEPAYGRDYRSREALLADWRAGKDFLVSDWSSPWDGKPTNISDCRGAGIESVSIRYFRRTRVAVIDLI